jgi:hypothetical protein
MLVVAKHLSWKCTFKRDEAGKAPTNLRSSPCDWYGLIQRHGWKEMAAQPTTTHYRDKSLIKWLRPMRVG